MLLCIYRHTRKVPDSTDFIEWISSALVDMEIHGRSGQLKVTRFHSQLKQGQDPSQTLYREREKTECVMKWF